MHFLGEKNIGASSGSFKAKVNTQNSDPESSITHEESLSDLSVILKKSALFSNECLSQQRNTFSGIYFFVM